MSKSLPNMGAPVMTKSKTSITVEKQIVDQFWMIDTMKPRPGWLLESPPKMPRTIVVTGDEPLYLVQCAREVEVKIEHRIDGPKEIGRKYSDVVTKNKRIITVPNDKRVEYFKAKHDTKHLGFIAEVSIDGAPPRQISLMRNGTVTFRAYSAATLT